MLDESSSDPSLRHRAPALPKVFDPEFYRTTYPALANYSDADVELHFRKHGIRYGLMGSPAVVTRALIPLVQKEASVLEIGPFHAPAISGPQVKYLDAYKTQELIARARKLGLDPGGVPAIDYVSPTGAFDMVDRTFSAAFGSHSIEHQPDLIRHLRNISSVLDAEGRYYIICPDKRFCFDHFLPETTIADVVAAFIQEAKRHQPRSFGNHLLLTTHNECVRHWANDHGLPIFKAARTLRIPELTELIRQTEYVDCHAWQFTPQTFFEITATLFEMGLTDLCPERVYQTPKDRFEFTAVLRKTRHAIDAAGAFISEDLMDERQQRAELEQTFSEQQSQLLAASDQINALTEKVAHLENQLHAVYQSRSWRMMSPVRTMVDRVKARSRGL